VPADAEPQPVIDVADLEVQPAVNPATPAPLNAEIQPTLQRTEPLHADNSQLLNNRIDQQRTANEVDQPADAPTYTSEVEWAEPRQPTSTKVEPTLNGAELVEIQPAVSAREPLVVSPKAQSILGRPGLQVQSTAHQEQPLPVSTEGRPIPKRTVPQLQPTGLLELPLPVGSEVWAICKLGTVAEGAPGIITGVADARFFWQSPTYLCTFANNRKVRARAKDIEAYNHGHSLQELEHPNLDSIQSRRMALRAEQLLSRQRPTRRRVQSSNMPRDP
jgi:hypothetical protein